MFADVSNRKPETPYPFFLEGPAPWRLRPGPCVAPPRPPLLVRGVSEPGRGWGGGRAAGVPGGGALPLRSAPKIIPSTHFVVCQILPRKPLIVLRVRNTTGLQLARQGVKSSEWESAAKSAHRPPHPPPPGRHRGLLEGVASGRRPVVLSVGAWKPHLPPPRHSPSLLYSRSVHTSALKLGQWS